MADEARRIDDSIKELAGNVNALALQQARMDGKLDTLIQAKDDHEKRLRAVEQLRTQIITLAVVVSTVIPAVVSYLLGHVS